MIRFRNIILVVVSAIAIWSCTPETLSPSNSQNVNPSDRAAMLTFWADSIILPSYEAFDVKMQSFVVKSDSFTQNPTKNNLIAFRQAWVDTYIEWQKIELFDFGPASDETLRNFFNIYPTNITNIKSNISSESANFELPLSYPTQGFPALDYLINGISSTDDSIVIQYSTATDALKRRNYVKKISTQMNSKWNTIYNSWKSGYRTTFISQTSINASASTSKLVNGFVLNYEKFIRSGKFGIPSGAISNTASFSDKVEAFYKKDISLTLAQSAHQASIDFFNGKSRKSGKEGLSLKTYLNSLNATDSKTGTPLSTAINTQFQTVNTKMSGLNSSLYQQILNDNSKMVDVFNEMQKTVRLLKVDMPSAMSVSIVYYDNDGD